MPAATPESDAAQLLKLKQSFGNNEALQSWIEGTIPCPKNAFGPYGTSWVGVLCFNGTVWGLQLEDMELEGEVDVDILAGLPGLRTFSCMRNRLEGPIPMLARVHALKSVYLSDNKFYGEIPEETFQEMKWLKKVHLARNAFEGRIPASLTSLPRLLVLRLEENQFEGEIPEVKHDDVRVVNVSYNQLEGHIPSLLGDMDVSSFFGNYDLCGKPLNVTCKLTSTSKNLSTALLVVLIIVAIVVALAIILLLITLLRRQSGSSEKIPPTSQNKVAAYDGDQLEQGSQDSSGSSQKKSGKDHNQGKLIFLIEDRQRFELQDLLRSSAEVLGSGSFGSSYKAVLLNGPSLVVKRFREMNGVGREDFQEHMRRLGRLKHPNLLPIVAYYYRKDEKLLVTDFVGNGSLVQLLHGNRSPDRPTLNWLKRLNIVKGVARCLSYLHNELPILTLPHGHLKSSNVLLNDSFEPILMDYALAPVMNKDHARQLMVAYKSPECVQHVNQVNRKSDVWSLGILILEIMTGKFPANYLAQGKGGMDMDLAGWVNSIARAEWTDEVFDSQMEGPKNGEMWKLLKIGLHCCEVDVDKRWEMKVALEKIEELREQEANPSVASEEEMHSSKDEFSIS
ncbi:hypothetical protein AAC387_Pa05g2349 [Persea americana]